MISKPFYIIVFVLTSMVATRNPIQNVLNKVFGWNHKSEENYQRLYADFPGRWGYKNPEVNFERHDHANIYSPAKHDKLTGRYSDLLKEYDNSNYNEIHSSQYDSEERPYRRASNDYKTQQSDYDSKLNNYDEAPRNFDAQTGTYDASLTGYDSPSNGYDAPSSNYNTQSSGYNSPSSTYGSPYYEPSDGYSADGYEYYPHYYPAVVEDDLGYEHEKKIPPWVWPTIALVISIIIIRCLIMTSTPSNYNITNSFQETNKLQ